MPSPMRVSQDLRAMFAAYREAASATADLAAAELRLAASATVLLLALGVAIGLLVASAWIVAMFALAALLADAAQWPGVLAGVAGVNLVAAAGLWLWVRALTPNLTFRELRALLAGGARDAEPDGGPT